MNFQTQPWRRLIQRRDARRAMGLSLALALAAWCPTSVRASTAYGDLNNFDVFNDTGQECHGFEIELEDLHSTDITYTFDWNHYGAPTITEDNSVPGHPKVIIRWAAKYASGAFTAYTAMPTTAPSPTNGHMCTDISVNFGCEHFGVGHYGVPTAVRYNWLIDDPVSPGTLIKGPPVNVATPNWAYYPPAGGNPAAVQAVILAPPPPPAPVYEFGDAVWVKCIVTVSHNNAPVWLEDLVSDDPDDPSDPNWANGEPDEVEVEWHILQTEFNNPAGANNGLAGGEEEMPDGDEVITRRYEFYKYTGPLDTETNEAKCDNYPQISDPADLEYKPECDPAAVTVLGDYIGAQMAGFNVEAVLGLIDHLQDGEVFQPYTPRTVVVGGNTPYTTEVTAGALPPDMVLDSATGVLSGTPSADGEFTFTIAASDADLVQVSRTYIMVIAGLPDLCTDVICIASDDCHVAGVCDPATGLCSDPPAADGTACDDGDACTEGDACLGGMCTGGAAVVCADEDVCTHDVCEDGVCMHHALEGCCNADAECEDADVCTLDTCVDHACMHADVVDCCLTAAECDDGDVCTMDLCVANICRHELIVDCCRADGECSDGNVCTSDACVDGACEYSPLVGCCNTSEECDDTAPCSEDSCVEHVCMHAEIPSCCVTDAECDDADACTLDSCVGNRCEHDFIAGCCHGDGECDDGNPCTGDACVANVCEFTALPACCYADDQCADGDDCTADVCVANSCLHDLIPGCCLTDADCDDGDFCTSDLCVNGTCAHEPVADCCGLDADCDDGIDCTVDACNAGVCMHTADDSLCGDDVSCTRDYCDPSFGCMHVAEDALCDDGLFCNGAERCHPTSGCKRSNRKPCPPPFCDEANDRCLDRPVQKMAPVWSPHEQ